MQLVFKGVFRVESNAIHGLVETRPKGVFAASENDIFPPGNQLKSRKAARLVKDADAPEHLMDEALALLGNKEELARIEKNAAALSLPDAAKTIVDEAYKLLENK